MDWYALVKFLHVLAAIVWLGGGFCLLVMAVLAERARDDAELLHVMQKVVFLANRMFVPAALATLILGLALTWMAWSITDFWLLLTLACFAASFLLGTVVIKPRADRLTADAARDGASPSVADQCRRLLGIAKFDFIILFMIVAIMVLKPAPDDRALLAAFAAILVAAGLAFLMPLRRKAAEPA